MKFKFSLVALLSMFGLAGCFKDTELVDDRTEKQRILDYLDQKGLTATEHPDGFFYNIETPGNTTKPTIRDTVKVKYKGFLLDDMVFDQNQSGVQFPLNRLIRGWQLAIPLLGEGGKMRIYLPSNLGYGSRGSGSIPPNAPLGFDIELLKVN